MINFRGAKVRFVVLSAILLTILLFSSRSSPMVNGQTYPNITSYRVSGAPNYDAPGNESFWSTMDWTNVPLAASVSPGGGQTSEVSIKSANDGFNVYVLLKWTDMVGPSFGWDGELYRASGRDIGFIWAKRLQGMLLNSSTIPLTIIRIEPLCSCSLAVVDNSHP